MIEIIKKHFKKIVIAILGIFTLTAAASTVLMVPQGGTGVSTFTAGGILQGDGTGVIQSNIMSGDGTLSSSGVLTVSADAVETITVEGKATETIAMGKAVYISGAVGNNVQFSLADNTVNNKTDVAGVAIESKTAGQTIRVRHVGQLDNFDTSAWADGDDLYLSTAGSLINTVPTSGTTLHVAYVEYSHASLGDILLHVCGEKNIGAPASTDLFLRMGDSAGVNKLSYRDYANNEVGYVNSDGNILFPKLTGGTTTTSDLTLQTTSGVGTTGADMHFLVGNNGATEAMTILNNGNVGIGTNAPADKLDVAGGISSSLAVNLNFSEANIYSTGFNVKKRGTTGDATAALTIGTEMGYHGFYGWDGTSYGRGSYVLTTTTEAWNATSHGTSYSITTTPNGSTTNVSRLTIDQNGNVGIGTASPAQLLHMEGDGTAAQGWARFGLSSTEYTEIGHKGSNSAINAVGDGNLDFRHDSVTKMSLTDAGVLTATTFTGALSGNATTATALAANGANCSAGQYPLGVDASGAVESCTNVNTVWLTNKSGGSLAANDVVVIDTSNDNAVTTTTVARNELAVGVIKTGGVANAQVEVQIAGIVNVKITTAVSGPGYFLGTSIYVKEVAASGTSGTAGDFLMSLSGGGDGATITAIFKKAEIY